MNLPTLELSGLPDLGQLTGAPMTAMFGASPSMQQPGSDDSIVILATYLYETGGGAG